VVPSGSMDEVIAIRSCLAGPVREKMPYVISWVK
jgi:hypothetical protein